MGVAIEIVAQYAMDRYYGEYKASSQFLDIDDFISGCGFAFGTVMQKMYQLQYAELRADQNDSIVSFDPLILNEQILEVKKEGNSYTAKFTDDIMSFGFSDQSVGVQQVTVVEPSNSFGEELERFSKQASWQMKYVPFVNKLFFMPSKEGITIIKKGFCNVSKVAVSYVPSSVNKDYVVPDGMVDEIISECITIIREAKLPVVKKTNDQNQNMVMETEMNKQALK